jgi:hypothetical protein
LQGRAAADVVGMRWLVRLVVILVAAAALPIASAGAKPGHAKGRKFDYRYKAPKYKYKAPKLKGRKTHR